MRPLWFRALAQTMGVGLAVLVSTADAGAQDLPSGPLVFGDGHVTVGGQVSATASCSHSSGAAACTEDTGFFNYSDYAHSLIRMVRFDVNAALRASDHLSVLGEVRSENGERPQPYALYVRYKPWLDHNVDVQAGRVPPTFGAFTRRTYANDNLLIGYPLGYQYLTSLHPNAVPASADELLRMRGRGWLSAFSLGDRTPLPGVPLVAALRWDTGVQVHAGTEWIEVAGSITTGSLAEPVLAEDKRGQQVAGRVAVHPLAGLHVGVSAARGPFLTRAAERAGGAGDRRFGQTAFGADVEYSRDHYLVRAESIHARWRMPTIAEPLDALATSVEGRYKMTPRLHAAARVDRLTFTAINGSTRRDEWEAPVTRVEAGGGYLLRRNLQIKLSVQRNVRDGGRVPRLTVAAAQLLYWL